MKMTPTLTNHYVTINRVISDRIKCFPVVTDLYIAVFCFTTFYSKHEAILQNTQHCRASLCKHHV